MATEYAILPRFEVRPLSSDEGGGYLLEFPDYPGCMADGDTPEDALRKGRDALASYLQTLAELKHFDEVERSAPRLQATDDKNAGSLKENVRSPSGLLDAGALRVRDGRTASQKGDTSGGASEKRRRS